MACNCGSSRMKTAAVVRAARARSKGCGCGGASKARTAGALQMQKSAAVYTAAPVKSAASCGCGEESCSINPFKLDCDQKRAIQACFQQAICDSLRCIDDAFCPAIGTNGDVQGGIIQRAPGAGQSAQTPYAQQTVDYKSTASNALFQLLRCLDTAVCTLARCIPDAICGPETQALPPAPGIPCDLAVEEESA